MKLPLSGYPFREHGLIMTIIAGRGHREVHIQVTAITIFFDVVLVQSDPRYCMIKRAHLPVNMTTYTSGLRVFEGLGIPVTGGAGHLVVVWL